MKYLICESKARAMGISRETYVAWIESMGYIYSLETHCVDAYGVKVHPTDGRAILCVDTTAPYYAGLPEVHKSRLVDASEVNAQGWDIPLEG